MADAAASGGGGGVGIASGSRRPSGGFNNVWSKKGDGGEKSGWGTGDDAAVAADEATPRGGGEADPAQDALMAQVAALQAQLLAAEEEKRKAQAEAEEAAQAAQLQVVMPPHSTPRPFRVLYPLHHSIRLLGGAPPPLRILTVVYPPPPSPLRARAQVASAVAAEQARAALAQNEGGLKTLHDELTELRDANGGDGERKVRSAARRRRELRMAL